MTTTTGTSRSAFSAAPVWERYRAPFLAAVGEGREQGAFTPTASPGDVVDLVLSALAGATVFRVLNHPAPPPAGFRGVLLAQLRSMLGLETRTGTADVGTAGAATPG